MTWTATRPARRLQRPRAVQALAVLAAITVAASGCTTTASARPAPAVAAAAVPSAATTKPPPNLVFVLTDDLEPSLLRFMPTVRSMQAHGAHFTNYTVSDSLCCPSRSSIFTGQYPHNTGIFTNTAPDGGYVAFQRRGLEQATFAVDLQRAGYRTGFMGKYLNGYDPLAGTGKPGSNVPPGWNEWDVAGNGYPEFNYTLNENGLEVTHGHRNADYLTDVLAAKGDRFIRTQAAAGKPFALEVATFAPHSPYTPAPRDAHKYPHLKAPRSAAFNEANISDKPAWLRGRPKLTRQQIGNLDQAYRLRAQAVRSVDALLKGLRTTLTATGQADNTYVVFSSDNGYHMGEHRLPAGKQTAFATDLVVPLVVTGPGVAKRSIPQLAQNVDLAPTFAGLAGAAALPKADGRSLAPLLHGRKPADWRTASLVEHHGPNMDPADPDRPGKNGANPPSYKAITTRNATYVEYVGGAREYYNNRADPHQLHNAYSTLSAKRRAALAATLARLASCQGTTSCQVR
jgi:N-acetylglucosamine-6-sulfatase